MHKLQKAILELAKHEDVSQYGYRKLGEKVGIDHPQKVKWHLNKLIKDGHLYKAGDGSMRVSEDEQGARLAKVPILGLANCGEPLAYADSTEHGFLTVSPSLLKTNQLGNIFAVQAVGNSMDKASVKGKPVYDGDYVIVDASVEVPENGDYIVSSVEGLANVKRFVRDDQNQVVALVSESSSPRPPIVISEGDLGTYRVHGKVVGVVPSYSF